MGLKTNKKAFTLIELLVVIAIIGLLSTMAVVALSGARKKSRDAKRVSDIKQIQTALELYYFDLGAYPTEATAITLGDSDHDTLSSTSGFADTAAGTTYMGKVPADPGVDSGYAYSYLSADGSSYTITFGLTGATGSLECTSGYDSTCCTADENGITCS